MYQQMEKSKNRLRFEKVATKRVQKILDNLSSLSKCSNIYNYEYAKEDIDSMMKEIKSSVSVTESIFRSNLKSNNSKFKF